MSLFKSSKPNGRMKLNLSGMTQHKHFYIPTVIFCWSLCWEGVAGCQVSEDAELAEAPLRVAAASAGVVAGCQIVCHGEMLCLLQPKYHSSLGLKLCLQQR
jgi:hypothetical protein